MTRWLSISLVGCLSVVPGMVQANLDPACDIDGDGEVDGFDASRTTPGAQEWHLANVTALSLTPSALKAPRAYKAFKFTAGLELNQFDSLSCAERTVFLGTTQKNEDTNKTAVIPRPRLTISLPFSSITLSGIPPVKLFGVRTGIFSVEAAAGIKLPVLRLRPGVRFHLTGGQIVGDIAHPIGLEPGEAGYDDAAVDDEYQFVNVGADVSLGWEVPIPVVDVVPYIGGGVLGVSSIFYVGEDAYTVFTGDYFLKYQHEENPSNAMPGFRGVDLFAGVQVSMLKKLDAALEVFYIPVAMSLDEAYYNEDGTKSDYISPMVSVRTRVGWTF